MEVAQPGRRGSYKVSELNEFSILPFSASGVYIDVTWFEFFLVIKKKKKLCLIEEQKSVT